LLRVREILIKGAINFEWLIENTKGHVVF